jgi:hypothetical protein
LTPQPREALNKSAPRAAWLLRDEAQGAKPKASLHGLPGLATQRIARKTTPPKGFGPEQTRSRLQALLAGLTGTADRLF